MLETTGNIWDYYDEGYWLVISTNGFVKKNGQCVMGAGIAKQAAKRFPDLPLRLGTAINMAGNIVLPFVAERILTFPVKHNWWEVADLDLIEKSAQQLAEYTDLWCGKDSRIAMVRPGCGNGQLEWDEVREAISPILSSSRYIIVDNGSGDRSRAYHNRRAS